MASAPFLLLRYTCQIFCPAVCNFPFEFKFIQKNMLVYTVEFGLVVPQLPKLEALPNDTLNDVTIVVRFIGHFGILIFH